MTDNSSSHNYSYYSFPPTPNRNSPRSTRSQSISSNKSGSSHHRATSYSTSSYTIQGHDNSYNVSSVLYNSMPSPAAGKGDTPRTPTKLGRKPQSSAPKLNKPQQGKSEDAPTPDVPEQAEDLKQQGQEKAEDAKNQAQDTAEDTKQQGEEAAQDTKGKAEEAAEDTTGKVSQAGDELEQADPKPIDDDNDADEEDDDDKYGNVKGHAEPWSEEEEEEVDLSALAGATVNKAGNIVDSSGQVIGRVAEGDPATLAGKKVDGKGQIWDNEGNVIGRGELVHGADNRPEGPFAGFDEATVVKDGTVQTPAGDIIGRVIEGDVKKLTGHKVDEDGDINDKNGNVIGKAERWEPEEKERRINPMAGMRVNKEGEVRDENGDVLGRLTAGDLGHCAGLEIDDNGYVIDNDGNKVGEVTLLENIQEENEDETDEERQRREDSELAKKMSAICEDTLQRVQPVMKQITEYIEQADRTPRDELDEEELVNNVKPLIEEGSRILNDCNGSLRGLDPDGRIAAQAKGRQQTGEASPEEYKLADNLKELTTTVVTTIDNAKKKISDMPHAKKKLNPLWALLTEPLFQIIAAVGLLLTGVLNLVGKLLNGLGLGGLVNGLLGGLGINKLLGGLGLGGLGDMLGGGGDKDKKKKGGSGPMSMVGGLLGKK